MGVVSAILRLLEINYVDESWVDSNPSQLLAFGMMLLLCGFIFWQSLRARPESE